EEQKQLKLIQDQAAEAHAAATAAVDRAADARAAKGGTIAGVDQGNMIRSKDADGNDILISGDPTKNTGVYAAETADGSFGQGFTGTVNPQFDPGTSGVGFGNQQIQDAYSAANAKAWFDSEIAALQKTRAGYENSDIARLEDLVPAIDKQIASLHAQA